MKSMTKQRFELTAGTSDKFWEIGVDGTDVEVRFGRNGTNGQTNIKSFPTLNAARRHADKLIREKTAKGYAEIR